MYIYKNAEASGKNNSVTGSTRASVRWGYDQTTTYLPVGRYLGTYLSWHDKPRMLRLLKLAMLRNPYSSSNDLLYVVRWQLVIGN